jgi:hypothetical protein
MRYFRNNDAVFQDNSAPIRTAGTVQSWFEEDECELQHLPWPVLSRDLNTVEPHWSVLLARVRNRFPSPTSLTQLDVLQEEWYKIPLQTVENLCEFFLRTVAVLKAKGGPTPIKKCLQYL